MFKTIVPFAVALVGLASLLAASGCGETHYSGDAYRYGPDGYYDYYYVAPGYGYGDSDRGHDRFGHGEHGTVRPFTSGGERSFHSGGGGSGHHDGGHK